MHYSAYRNPEPVLRFAMGLHSVVETGKLRFLHEPE